MNRRDAANGILGHGRWGTLAMHRTQNKEAGIPVVAKLVSGLPADLPIVLAESSSAGLKASVFSSVKWEQLGLQLHRVVGRTGCY